MTSRSNICATGVRWRRFGLDDEQKFFGAGLYYGSGTSEAPQCVGEQVVVVGGANSAGQATMNLSRHAGKVTLLVRGSELSTNMSAYLVDRLAAQPNVEVRTGTSISRLIGDQTITAVEVRTRTGERAELVATRIFVCIGGEANTEWAEGSELIRDEHGLFLTGNDLSPELLQGNWPLQRRPFDLESSVPGFFAIGDVRKGSIKRIASAVGEGALAVSYVHRFLAEAD